MKLRDKGGVSHEDGPVDIKNVVFTFQVVNFRAFLKVEVLRSAYFGATFVAQEPRRA